MPAPVSARDPTIDIARGLAMLLVLYGHAAEMFAHVPGPASAAMFVQWQWVYSFHMPAFFLISGLVHQDRGMRKALQTAVALVLTAYAVHAVVWLLTMVAAGGRPWWGGLFRPLLRLENFFGVIVWFLTALALVQIVHAALQRIRGGSRMLLLAAVVAGFAVVQWQGSNLLHLSALLPGLAFFAAGHRLAGSRLLRPSGAWAWIAPLAAFGVVSMLAPLNHGCSVDPAAHCPDSAGGFGVLMIDGRYGFGPLFLVTALAGSAAVCWTGSLLSTSRASALAHAAAWIGRNTMALLVLNCLAIWFAQPLIEQYLGGLSTPAAVAVVSGVVLLQLAIGRVAHRLLAWPYRVAQRVSDRWIGVPAARAGTVPQAR